MANDNNIKIFTAADIEKYHNGQLSAKDMHALEKAALDDPFLADALEGYTVAGVNVSADIAELKKRLNEKTEKTRVVAMHGGGRSSFPWLRVAAMIVVIATAGLLSYQFLFKTKEDSVAQVTPAKQESDQLKTPGTASAKSQENKDSLGNNVSIPALPPVGSTAIGDIDADGTTDKLSIETTDPAPLANAKTEHDDSRVPESSFKNIDNNLVITAPSYKVADTSLSFRKNNTFEKNTIALKDQHFADQYAAKKKADNGQEGIAGFYGYNSRDGYDLEAGKVAARNKQANQAYRNNLFRGQVTDNNGSPLPFANITNIADNVGTSTDAKGYFTLVSPYDSVMNVQVRAIGFENNRLQLRSDVGNNNVRLEEDKTLTAIVIDTFKRNYARRLRDANMTLEEPEPEPGWESYDSYLANNQMDIPEVLDIKKNTGSDAVELSFEVDKHGAPINIKVEKSLCEKCDKEAIRLIKEGPKWKRKAKKGKRTTVTVPFIKTD